MNPISKLFRDVVSQNANTLAIQGPRARLSYNDLLLQSESISRGIQLYGGQGKALGVLIPRGEAQILAMLGVIHSDACYVYLDPEWPEQRLLHVINEAHVDLLIAGKLRVPQQFELLTELNTDLNLYRRIDEHGSHDFEGNAHLFYCFTSGSTGRPKGYGIKGQSVVRLIRDYHHSNMRAGDRCLYHFSPAFDASFLQTLLPLHRGASVVVRPAEFSPQGILDAVQNESISHLSLTSMHLSLLMKENLEAFRVLKELIVGGERFSPLHFRQLYQHFPDCRILNSYGPGENAIVSTVAELGAQDLYEQELPIGHPVQGTEVLLLNGRDELIQAQHQIGEIVLSGTGLSSGYLNASEAEERAFIPHPLDPHERAYRSGDLAYYRDDGQLVYYGRQDRQIKWRGARLEVLEIESKIQAYPGVERAFVTLQNGDLCAYLQSPHSSFDLDALKVYLQASLPKEMLPEFFFHLQRFPLNANGKIDCSQLPQPLTDSPESQDTLQTIWQSLLQQEIEPETHFFQAGGHSLLALRLIQELSHRLSIEIPLSSLYAHPVYQDFCRALQKQNTQATAHLGYPLWLHHHLHGSDAVYNTAFQISFDPQFRQDIPQAVSTLLTSHPHLCLRIQTERPELYFKAFESPPVREYDYSQLSPEQAQLELQWQMQKAAKEPFPWVQGGALIRFEIYHLPMRSVLLGVLHHVLGDAQSFEALGQQIQLLVKGERPVNEPETLTSISLAPVDTQAEAPLLEHYRGWPALNWPLYSQSNEAAVLSFELSHQDFVKLKSLAERAQQALSTIVLTAYALSVQYFTQETQVPLGVVTQNQWGSQRQRSYAVNLFPLLLAPDPTQSWLENLKRTRREQAWIWQYHATPGYTILPEQSAGIEAVFSWRPLRDRPTPIEPVHHGLSPFLMTLEILEADQHLKGRFEFQKAAFPQALEQRFLAHFLNCLRDIALEQPIQQQARAQRAYSAPDALSAPPATLLQQFQKWVRQQPTQTALYSDKQSYSYAELDRQSEILARKLKVLGLGKGTRQELVAIYGTRSIDMVCYALAVLKLNAAFLMISAQAPIQHNVDKLNSAHILLDSTQGELMPRFYREKLTWPQDLLLITQAMLDDTDIQSDSPLPPASSDRDAYHVFSSGSSGQPKAIAVSHDALSHCLAGLQAHYRLTPEDRLLQFLDFSFDVGLKEWMSALWAGASLYFHAQPQQLSAVEFQELCEHHRISVVHLPPATWVPMSQSLEQLNRSLSPSLRLMITGGEAFTPEQLAQLARLAPQGLRFLNEYGPSETTITSSLWELSLKQDMPVDEIKIGQPLPGVVMKVVNAQGDSLPPLVPGELWIGGSNLGRYLDPELQRQSFVEDAQGFFYRSGDRVRMSPDGIFTFIGRCDRQIKLNGYRIEPGEIEQICVALPEILEARVLCQTLGRRRFLCAYLQARPPYALRSPQEYQKLLGRSLPPWMLPQHYIEMQSWPHLPSGKLDIQALPQPSLESRYSRPLQHWMDSCPELARLVELWAAYFPGQYLDLDSDFFLCGGQSSMAAAFLEQAAEWGYTISAPQFFSSPKLGDICQMAGWTLPEYQASPQDQQLHQDLQLPLPHVNPPDLRPLKSVLLTGATGFLGAHLLADLMAHTEAQLYCLVRAQTQAEAEDRLRENLLAHKRWDAELAQRIVALPGDLSQPFLGLDETEYYQLQRHLDAILHNGASVNLAEPYAQIRRPNVLGTLELLRLAAGQTQSIPLHYVSSVAVFPFQSEHFQQLVPEKKSELRCETPLQTAYAQSKWVSEQLLERAAQAGLVAQIYRPGRITGDRRLGVHPQQDFMLMFLRACLEWKIFPDLDIQVDFTPVNYVSQAIVYLMQEPEAELKYYHLVNPHPIHWKQLQKKLVGLGFVLKSCELEDWIQALQKRVLPGHFLYPLLPILSEPALYQYLNKSVNHVLGTYQAQHRLKNSLIHCPPIDHDFLASICMEMIQNAWIPAP